jgi:hypothetical protein
VLERFKIKHQQSSHVLLVFDGTEHFSSEKLHCPNCTKRKLKNKTRPWPAKDHSVITPIVVSPEQSEVISLEPAFILPQDGEEKSLARQG